MKDQIVDHLLNVDLNDVQMYSFEKTIKTMAEQFNDVSAEETAELESDLAMPISSGIRRALVGRYPLCLKLCDDFNSWDGSSPTYIDASGLLNEPCVIAAAIALRPFQLWEWHFVEAWSWVYRHAVEMDVSIDGFEEWCEFRDPHTSREFLTTQLTWLYRRLFPSEAQSLTPPNPENGNA